MRFYFMEMLLYILSHIVTGTVSGTCLLKATVCSWWSYLIIFLTFLKMILSSSFHLDGQTIVLDDYLEIRPENRDKVQGYIDQGNIKLVLYILQMTTWFPVKPTSVIPWLVKQNVKKWGQINPDWLFPGYLWKYGQAPQILQNQAFTWQPLVVVSTIDLTTKSSKMSSSLPSFQNVLAGCRRKSCPRYPLCQLVQ